MFILLCGGSRQAGKDMVSLTQDFGTVTPEKGPNTKGNHALFPTENHRKQFKAYSQNPNMEPAREPAKIKRQAGEGRLSGKGLEPLAKREELSGIPSSEIQVLFVLSLHLWIGHARSYQYITSFIHSTNIYSFIYVFLELLSYAWNNRW